LFISKLGRFGEVSAEEKDSISHRAEALIKLKAELEKIYKEG
jgi:inosine/xanthosine triphosphate pyrophosphatase family protein